MQCKWAMIVVLLAGFGTLYAQPPDDTRPQRGRRQMQRPDGGGPGMRLQMMAERLADRLELTPEQRTAYDALVEKYEAQNQGGGGREQMRELGRQMREARDAGDTARVEELREQMRAAGEGRAELARTFLDEVEPLLDDTQKGRLAEFRTEMDERMQRGNQWQERREMLRDLPDQLAMTPEQRTQYEALLEERRSGMMERMREQREARRGIQEQLEQARAAGDEARVAELQAQLGEFRPEWNGDDLFDAVREILTPEQQTRLAELQGQFAADPGPRGEGSRLDTQTVLRAAKRLKLEPAQEEQLREIIRTAQGARRERAPRGADQTARQAEAERAEALKTQINAILNADQQAEFEKLLASSTRGGGRGGRGPAGAGAGAGAPGGPPPDGARQGGGRRPVQRGQRAPADPS